MQKFKEFIKESDETVIDVDTRYLENNLEDLNAYLDKLSEKPYQNAPILLAQIRGALEKFGMIFPAAATNQFLNLGAELVYTVGDTGKFLYVVFDTNDDGFVDAYVQIVTKDELDDLVDMDVDELIGANRNPLPVRHSDWYRKRDDDAGNSDEY